MDSVRHVGDLGNIHCDDRGEVDADVMYSGISLTGLQSVLGRSLVVRETKKELITRINLTSKFAIASDSLVFRRLRSKS